ncbi:hypothetical protein Aduo_006367 [Ancylostoma duodenale]
MVFYVFPKQYRSKGKNSFWKVTIEQFGSKRDRKQIRMAKDPTSSSAKNQHSTKAQTGGIINKCMIAF